MPVEEESCVAKTSRILLVIALAVSMTTLGVWLGMAPPPPATSATDGVSGGDPYYFERMRLAGKSYLAMAEPGRHSEAHCFTRTGARHRPEISVLFWSLFAMESDVDLYFNRDQVARMLPMVKRTLAGYELAVRIEYALPSFLTAPQLAFLESFHMMSREDRDRLEGQPGWSPGGLCPDRQDPFVWRGLQLLKTQLDPAARVPADRSYPRQASVIPIPDFYWGLVAMLRLHPELALDKKQAWRLYHATEELAKAILDYESFTQDYARVFRPEQKAFVEGKVAVLSHVFPP